MLEVLRTLLFFVVVVLTCAAPAVAQETQQPPAITIFAAASLSDSVGELAHKYESDNKRPLKLSFASSSVLARQIENGAPADLFLSADEEWMRYLDERKLVAPGTWVRPIGNQLVLISPADRTVPLKLTKGFAL